MVDLLDLLTKAGGAGLYRVGRMVENTGDDAVVPVDEVSAGSERVDTELLYTNQHKRTGYSTQKNRF